MQCAQSRKNPKKSTNSLFLCPYQISRTLVSNLSHAYVPTFTTKPKTHFDFVLALSSNTIFVKIAQSCRRRIYILIILTKGNIYNERFPKNTLLRQVYNREGSLNPFKYTKSEQPLKPTFPPFPKVKLNTLHKMPCSLLTIFSPLTCHSIQVSLLYNNSYEQLAVSLTGKKVFGFIQNIWQKAACSLLKKNIGNVSSMAGLEQKLKKVFQQSLNIERTHTKTPTTLVGSFTPHTLTQL